MGYTSMFNDMVLHHMAGGVMSICDTCKKINDSCTFNRVTDPVSGEVTEICDYYVKRSNRVPPHIVAVFNSGREFKQFQRKNVRDIQRLVSNDLRRGCAYFPVSGTKKVDQICKLLDELREELSVEQWGR